MASARSPMLSASSNVLSGSIAAQTQCGERERRCTASASLTSPSFTALSSAKSSSSWTWVTRTSYRKEREKAAACSATSTNQARTVLGSTANTRATARMPKPSASAPPPTPTYPVIHAYRETVYRGSPGSSRHSWCNAAGARGHRWDDRWHEYCPARASRHSDRWDRDSNGARCPPGGGVRAWSRCEVVGRRGPEGETRWRAHTRRHGACG